MMPFAPPLVSGPAPVVTVSGYVINDIVTAGTKIAGVIWHADGTVSSVVGSTITQISNATDWVRPAAFAGSQYEIRYTTLTGSAFFTAASAEDTWISLGADRRYDVRENGGGITSNNVVFEIRLSGGSVLDSATYTCTADDT